MNTSQLIIFLCETLFVFFIISIKKWKQKFPYNSELTVIGTYLGKEVKKLEKLKKKDPALYYEKVQHLTQHLPEKISTVLNSPSDQMKDENQEGKTHKIKFQSNPFLIFLIFIISLDLIFGSIYLFSIFFLGKVISLLAPAVLLPSFIGSILNTWIFNYVLFGKVKVQSDFKTTVRVPKGKNIYQKTWDTAKNVIGMVGMAGPPMQFYEPLAKKGPILINKVARILIFLSIFGLVFVCFQSILGDQGLFRIILSFFYLISIIAYIMSMRRIQEQKFENFVVYFIFLGIFMVMDGVQNVNFFYIVFGIIYVVIGVFIYINSKASKIFRNLQNHNSKGNVFLKNIINLIINCFLFIDFYVVMLFLFNLGKFNLFSLFHWISVVFFILSFKSFFTFLYSYTDYFHYKLSFTMRRQILLLFYSVLAVSSAFILKPVVGSKAYMLFFSHNTVQFIISLFGTRTLRVDIEPENTKKKNEIKDEMLLKGNILQIKGEGNTEGERGEEKSSESNNGEVKDHNLASEKYIEQDRTLMEYLAPKNHNKSKSSIKKVVDKVKELLLSKNIIFLSKDIFPLDDLSEVFDLFGINLVKKTEEKIILNFLLVKIAENSSVEVSKGELPKKILLELIGSYQHIFLELLEKKDLWALIKEKIQEDIYVDYLATLQVFSQTAEKSKKVVFSIDTIYLTDTKGKDNKSKSSFPYVHEPNLHICTYTELSHFLDYLGSKYTIIEGIKKKQFSIGLFKKINRKTIIKSLFICTCFPTFLFALGFYFEFNNKIMQHVFIYWLLSWVVFYIYILLTGYRRKKNLYTPYHLKDFRIDKSIFEALRSKLPTEYYTQLIVECPYLKLPSDGE